MYCFHKAEVTYHALVWIGVVGIAPRDGCELLAPNEGAFINFLTLASSDSECRAKVRVALSIIASIRLEFEDVRPLSDSDSPFSRDSVNRGRVGGEQKSETRSVCHLPYLSPRNVM